MIDQQKKQIRKYIKELKQNYSFEDKREKSKIIFDQIEKLDDFKKAKTIMAYWSMTDEVHTHDFVLRNFPEKEIILPVVKGDQLELRKFTGIDNMKQGESFTIEEPTGETFKNLDDISIIIVPGVAFDSANNRLGRGKAYYDKLLKQSKVIKTGVCFDFQLIDSVPVDQYDVKMDLVISDKL